MAILFLKSRHEGPAVALRQKADTGGFFRDRFVVLHGVAGWRAAAAGVVPRMATRGEVDVKATVRAYNGASAVVQTVMLRARLGRLRGSARELLRGRRDGERSGLARVLAHAGGGVDERCACGAARETRAHWRTQCVMATEHTRKVYPLPRSRSTIGYIKPRNYGTLRPLRVCWLSLRDLIVCSRLNRAKFQTARGASLQH